MGGHQAVATGREILPDRGGTLLTAVCVAGSDFRCALRRVGGTPLQISAWGEVHYGESQSDNPVFDPRRRNPSGAKANRYNCVTNACGLPRRTLIGFTLDDRPGNFLQTANRKAQFVWI